LSPALFTSPSRAVAGISGTLVYDAQNQLTTTAGVTYVYDGDGRRVKKSKQGPLLYALDGNIRLETSKALLKFWSASLYQT
jgi:hypothetical protein